jgi:hypothetical protein
MASPFDPRSPCQLRVLSTCHTAWWTVTAPSPALPNEGGLFFFHDGSVVQPGNPPSALPNPWDPLLNTVTLNWVNIAANIGLSTWIATQHKDKLGFAVLGVGRCRVVAGRAAVHDVQRGRAPVVLVVSHILLSFKLLTIRVTD